MITIEKQYNNNPTNKIIIIIIIQQKQIKNNDFLKFYFICAYMFGIFITEMNTNHGTKSQAKRLTLSC